jgi:hypothetical protein
LRRFSQIGSQRSEEWCVEDTPYEKRGDPATKNAKSHEKKELALGNSLWLCGKNVFDSWCPQGTLQEDPATKNAKRHEEEE